MLIRLTGERHINPAHIATIEPEPYPASAYVWSVRMVSGDVVKLTRVQYEQVLAWCSVVSDAPKHGNKPIEFADAIGGASERE